MIHGLTICPALYNRRPELLGGFYAVIAGITLWGAQEPIMRTAIANMISADKRASAYGVFNAGYGLFWFIGSALMGLLYDVSIPTLIAFSVAVQLASLPFLIAANKAR